jgi:hypothetical protein
VGLLNMDLLLAVDYMFLGVVFLALYAALRRASPSAMAIALALELVAVAIYFASTAAGILLWRRAPWGDLLASVSLTFGPLMSITIPAWIAVPLIQDGQINVIEAAPFLVVSLVGVVLAGLFYASVREERGP